MRNLKLFVVLSALTVITACAPHASFENEFRSDSSANIIGGTTLKTRNTPASKSVVAMGILNEFGQQISFCTATLIGPQTILTAAHCFDKSLLPNASGKFTIVFNINAKSGGGDYRHGLYFTQHPLYNSQATRKYGKTYDHDIAVATFAGTIPKGYTTMKLDSDVTADYSGQEVYVYGFGRLIDYTGDIKGDNNLATSGPLRRGVMTVGPGYNTYPDRYYTSAASATFLCQGDSGGPQFYHEHGVLKLIGVNSAALGTVLASGKQSCKGTSQVTKVAPEYAWILTEQKKLLNRFN